MKMMRENNGKRGKGTYKFGYNQRKVFYDLQTESNAMMNILVLCTGDPIDKVLKAINKRYNINLSIPIISRIGLYRKIKSESISLDLQPIPLKWLGYSL